MIAHRLRVLHWLLLVSAFAAPAAPAQPTGGGGMTLEVELPDPRQSIGETLPVWALDQAGIEVRVMEPEEAGFGSKDCGLVLVFSSDPPDRIEKISALRLIVGGYASELEGVTMTANATGLPVRVYCLPTAEEVTAYGLEDYRLSVVAVGLPVAWGAAGPPLVLWALAVAAALALLWRRARGRAPGRPADPPLPEDRGWLARVAPIIRMKRFSTGPGPFGRVKVYALFRDELAICGSRRRRSFEPLHQAADGAALAAARVRRVRLHPLDEVTGVEVERGSLTGKVAITIRGARRVRIRLPTRDTPNLVRALVARLGAKVALDCPIRLRFVPILAVVLTSLCLPFLLAGGVLFFVGLGLALPFLGAITWALLTHLPRRPPERSSDEKFEDLSHRRPFRSPALSRLCKLLAIPSFLAIWVVQQSLEGSGAALGLAGGAAAAIGVVVAYFLVVNLLQIANRLAQHDPAKLRRADRRRPILYLRSFGDDRETSLHPQTPFSAAIGLDPPLHTLEAFEDMQIHESLVRWVKYFANYHPLRLWKLLVGHPLDTSEQQMASFFRRYGFFVAIGKPGEKFATTGAARMYVGNEEWMETVAELLAEARIVLLQPASTEGIWWEVEKVIATVEPERVLLCMLNYHERQNEYESFRLRAEGFLPAGSRLPRGVGNHHLVTFLTFDDRWRAREHHLVYYSRLGWLFRRRVVNLKKTLAPYLRANGMLDERGRIPRPS